MGVAGCVVSTIGSWSLFVRNADAGAMSYCADAEGGGVSAVITPQDLPIPSLLLFHEIARPAPVREVTTAETHSTPTQRT